MIDPNNASISTKELRSMLQAEELLWEQPAQTTAYLTVVQTVRTIMERCRDDYGPVLEYLDGTEPGEEVLQSIYEDACTEAERQLMDSIANMEEPWLQYAEDNLCASNWVDEQESTVDAAREIGVLEAWGSSIAEALGVVLYQDERGHEVACAEALAKIAAN